MVTSAHFELRNGEITVEAKLGQQVCEQHDEEALLVAGKDVGNEETIMCFSDELPLFIEQEGSIDVQNIFIQALQ